MLYRAFNANSESLQIPRLPNLIGDGKRLKQLLMNIVHNALKFTLTGSVSINASFCDHNSLLKVDVKDSGVGIS